MRQAAIPSYALYGEEHAPDQAPEHAPDLADFLHIETIAARSALHDWEIAPHRHSGFIQILLVRDGHARISFDGSDADAAGPCAVLVPLLFEVDWQSDFDFIVCVACSPSIQRHRLGTRGLNDAAIDQRLKSQLPLAEKMARAQAVIWTDGPPERQADQWRLILRRLKP